MLNLYTAMKTDGRREQEGVYLDLEHTIIRLARAGGQNQKFNAAAEKLAREHKRAFENDLMSSSKGKELLRALYADTVVLEWYSYDEKGAFAHIEAEMVPAPDDYTGYRYSEGVARPDGTIGEFNRANVIRAFTDLEDLLMICKETAESMAGFRQALIEEAKGN